MTPESNLKYVDNQPNVDVERLELLEPTIPLENRVSNLALSMEPLDVWLPTSTIADTIGCSRSWVKNTAIRFGLEIRKSDSVATPIRPEYFQPSTLELLQDEWEWQSSYKQLDPYLSSERIADFIGRSNTWTRKTLSDMNVKRKKIPSRDSNILYERSVIKKLRFITLSTPLDDGWYTLKDLEDKTGQDRDWISNRLKDLEIEGETRRSLSDGRLLTYFSPDVVEAINQAVSDRPPAGGDWLTAKAIESLVEKSRNWVNKRLEAKYRGQGEIRQDDQRVSRMHYPPSVLEELIVEAKELDKYPKKGDYLTQKALAKKVGHSVLWVKDRLDLIDAKREARLDNVNHIVDYYPPETAQKLLDLTQSTDQKSGTIS